MINFSVYTRGLTHGGSFENSANHMTLSQNMLDKAGSKWDEWMRIFWMKRDIFHYLKSRWQTN
jgi:hypothetical protein